MDNDGIPYGDIILIIPEGDTSTLHSYLFTIFAPLLFWGAVCGMMSLWSKDAHKRLF
jgi:hypothetical protein